jgi:NADH-quinone oxidoreductase subunit N
VLAAVWMRPATSTAVASPVPVLAGGSQELDPPEGPDEPAAAAAREEEAVEALSGPRGHWELTLVAVLAALATLATGIYPDPLFDLVRDAGESFRGLL